MTSTKIGTVVPTFNFLSNEVTKPEPKTIERLPIFERFKVETIKKLENAIEEANGRYGNNKELAAEKPFANTSKIWVVKTNREGFAIKHKKNGMEQIKVTLKVGKSNFPIGNIDKKTGKQLDYTMQFEDNLVNTLEELKTFVQSLTKDSDYGKLFWKLAKQSGMPPRFVADKTNPEFNSYEYDENIDDWVRCKSDSDYADEKVALKEAC